MLDNRPRLLIWDQGRKPSIQGTSSVGVCLYLRWDKFANGNLAGNYFSFPSFEDFLDFEESEERIDGRQEKGVP